MKRLFSILLVVILCLTFVACSENGPTTSEEELFFDAPKIAADMQDYLEKKYNDKFMCQGFSEDEATFWFSSMTKNGEPIAVYLNSYLLSQGFPAEHFTGHFSDDGYFKLNADKASTYYSKVFEQWGVHRILVSFSAPSLPAEVDTSWGFVSLLEKYPMYMNNTLYVLTDIDIPEAAFQYADSVLKAEANQVSLVVLKVPAEQQGDITIDHIVANPSEYQILWKSNVQ